MATLLLRRLSLVRLPHPNLVLFTVDQASINTFIHAFIYSFLQFFCNNISCVLEPEVFISLSGIIRITVSLSLHNPQTQYLPCLNSLCHAL